MPDRQPRQPVWLHCAKCRHTWAGAWLPLAASDFCRALTSASRARADVMQDLVPRVQRIMAAEGIDVTRWAEHAYRGVEAIVVRPFRDRLAEQLRTEAAEFPDTARKPAGAEPCPEG